MTQVPIRVEELKEGLHFTLSDKFPLHTTRSATGERGKSLAYLIPGDDLKIARVTKGKGFNEKVKKLEIKYTISFQIERLLGMKEKSPFTNKVVADIVDYRSYDRERTENMVAEKTHTFVVSLFESQIEEVLKHNINMRSLMESLLD